MVTMKDHRIQQASVAILAGVPMVPADSVEHSRVEIIG